MPAQVNGGKDHFGILRKWRWKYFADIDVDITTAESALFLAFVVQG